MLFVFRANDKVAEQRDDLQERLCKKKDRIEQLKYSLEESKARESEGLAIHFYKT